MIPSSLSHSPMKRPREDSPPGSDADESEPDENRIDFQRTEYITSTQAIGDENDGPTYDPLQLLPPVSVDHAALRADFEAITMVAMERLYQRITKDINKSAADTALAVQKTTDQLHGQIASMSTRITHLQQQILTY
jgi:hypothetical protein